MSLLKYLCTGMTNEKWEDSLCVPSWLHLYACSPHFHLPSSALIPFRWSTYRLISLIDQQLWKFNTLKQFKSSRQEPNSFNCTENTAKTRATDAHYRLNTSWLQTVRLEGQDLNTDTCSTLCFLVSWGAGPDWKCHISVFDQQTTN